MIEYIYFVKCPNCEDEPFTFFDEAKEFALGRMSAKPIITQIEVDRNDFGECTDSCDLGTVWSWEDMMNDTEKETADESTLLTKDFLNSLDPENDPEFATIDNSVDFEPVTSEVTALDSVPDNFRKPIPEGMTIEQLVEEMEENEDTVECTWCEELFDKDQCRKEVNLGWLCGRCEAAIKSRGETLTFKENNYWDFLDEAALKEAADFSHLSMDDLFKALADMKKEFGTNYKVTIDEVNNFIANWKPSSKNLEPAKESCDAGHRDLLDTLEEATDYRNRLTLCPECGAEEGFDKETGICIECGFSFEGI